MKTKKATSLCTAKQQTQKGTLAAVLHVFLDLAFEFRHKSALQDHSSLLVALAFVGGKFIDPAELCGAIFAGDVSDHVSAGQHNSVLYLAEAEIDNAVEEKSASRRAGEARRNQFSAICQRSLAVGTHENPRSTEVTKKNAPHLTKTKTAFNSIIGTSIL